MRKLLWTLFRDDCGAVGPEWACIMTVLVLGSVGAVVAAKHSLTHNVEKAVAIVATK